MEDVTHIVSYQVATYKGTEKVTCHPDDDTDCVIAKCAAQLNRKYGALPMGYQSFKIIETHY